MKTRHLFTHCRSLLACGTALFLTAAAAPFAQAATIIGNMPSNDGGSSGIITGTNQRATVFTMGSQDYTVDSVTLRLSNYNTATDVAQVGFFLDNGSGTNTGAQVGSFLTAPSSSSDAAADFTFSPSGSLTLAANTRYWLLVDETASNFNWNRSNPVVTPSGTAAAFDFYRLSGNNGVSYLNSAVFNSFQINGTLAGTSPEPSRTLLLMAGLGALMLRRRRKV